MIDRRETRMLSILSRCTVSMLGNQAEDYTTFPIKGETEACSEESSPHPKINLYLAGTKSPSRVICLLYLKQRLKQLSSTNQLCFINLKLVKMSSIWKAIDTLVSSLSVKTDKSERIKE